jgi:hypothetical protein
MSTRFPESSVSTTRRTVNDSFFRVMMTSITQQVGQYVCPIVSLLAVAANVAIIVGFSKLRAGGTSRVYYIVIAVLDLIEVLTKHFGLYFLLNQIWFSSLVPPYLLPGLTNWLSYFQTFRTLVRIAFICYCCGARLAACPQWRGCI